MSRGVKIGAAVATVLALVALAAIAYGVLSISQELGDEDRTTRVIHESAPDSEQPSDFEEVFGE